MHLYLRIVVFSVLFCSLFHLAFGEWQRCSNAQDDICLVKQYSIPTSDNHILITSSVSSSKVTNNGWLHAGARLLNPRSEGFVAVSYSRKEGAFDRVTPSDAESNWQRNYLILDSTDPESPLVGGKENSFTEYSHSSYPGITMLPDLTKHKLLYDPLIVTSLTMTQEKFYIHGTHGLGSSRRDTFWVTLGDMVQRFNFNVETAKSIGLRVNWISRRPGNTDPRICSGYSSNWRVLSADYLQNSIDYSGCNFPRVPILFSGVKGDSDMWIETGSTQYYSQTSTSAFVRVSVVYGLTVTPDTLYASKKWRVYWMAILPDENTVCYEEGSNNTKLCGGHGICLTNNQCLCNEGYLGRSCEVPICMGNHTLDPTSTVCSGRGICIYHNNCSCDSVTTGDLCDISICFSRNITTSLECSGHGSCSGPDHCICDENYYGQECNITSCFGFLSNQSDSVCSGQGECIDFDTCNCVEGRAGSSCELFSCFNASGSASCSGHGNCSSTDYCECDDGYDGIECNSSVPIYISLRTSVDTQMLVDPRKELSLIAQVSAVKRQMIFKWSAFENGTITNITLYLDESSTDSMLNLTLKENVLKPYSSYQFVFEAKYYDDSLIWSHNITIQVGGPPIIEEFSCSPCEGKINEMFTFSVVTKGSRDQYSFYYIDYFSNERVYLSPFSHTSTVSTLLPLPSSNGTKLDIFVSVKNEIDWTITDKSSVIIQLLSTDVEEEDFIRRSADNLTSVSQAMSLASLIQNRSARLSSQKEKMILKQAIEKIISYSIYNLGIELGTNGTASTTSILQVTEASTRDSNLVSSEYEYQVLDSLNRILRIQDGTQSEKPFVTTANIISNIADQGYTSLNRANQLKTTVNVFSDALLRAIPNTSESSEPSHIITTRNFEMQVNKNLTAIRGSAVKSTLVDAFVSITVPESFGEEESEGLVLAYVMTVFPKEKHPFKYSSNSDHISTPVLEFNIRYENGSVKEVSNQTFPFYLTFAKESNKDLSNPQASVECKYWSLEHNGWISDGMEVISENSTHFVCSSNHLTSFAAFVLYSEKDPYEARHAVAIAFNALFIILCFPILIILFCLHSKQPLKSRFIAPYLGLCAIIVDSSLQGIIRYSLIYTGQSLNSINGFSYVIMLTANPLTVIALFVYLWQSVRFIVLCNIYHLMSTDMATSKGQSQRIMKLSRWLASKLIYMITTTTSGLFVFGYFVILVVVAATRHNESERTVLTTIQSVSFAGIMVLIGIGILFSLIIDIILALGRRKEMTNAFLSESKSPCEEKNGISRVILLFTVRDPLKFRIEAVLILIAVLAILVLYPLGIASVFDDENKPLLASSLAFDLFLTFIKIAAFGGYIALYTLVMAITSGTPFKQLENSNSEFSLSSEKSILQMLRNPLGYQLTYQYCQSEFSLENLYLWKELENMRTDNENKTGQARKQALIQIHDMYLARNSEREVNISSGGKKDFISYMKSGEEISASDTEKAIALLYAEVMTNLADTMARFTATSSFKKYLDAQKVEIELKQTVV